MRFFGMVVTLLLSSCGYHLVGHGDGRGVIPADVSRLIVAAQGDEGGKQLAAFRDALQTKSLSVDVRSVSDRETQGADSPQDAILIIQANPASFTPSAFDASGVASQYRMIYSGQLSLFRQGRSIWQSGHISERGEVYVTADPTSIEASRQQLLRNLRKQWRQTALGRMRSGF